MGGPVSNVKEGVLRIPLSPSINGTLPSDCLMSYQRHLLGGGGLLFCRNAVELFYSSLLQPIGQAFWWGIHVNCAFLFIFCAVASNMNDFKTSIWPIDRSLTSTGSLDQTAPGSNSNEGVIHSPQISRTRSSPLDTVKNYSQEHIIFRKGASFLLNNLTSHSWTL